LCLDSYAADIYEIGFVDGKRANEENCSDYKIFEVISASGRKHKLPNITENNVLD
jgi:hypothetical protein